MKTLLFNKIPLLFFILTLCTTYCAGQRKTIPDSIQRILEGKDDQEKINILVSLSKEENKSNYSHALKIAEFALELSEKSKNKKGIAEALKTIGLANYFQGNHDKALEFYIRALKICEEMNDEEGIIYLENDIGNLYRKNGNADIAIKHLERALKIAEEKNNSDGLANTCNNIGVAYETKNEYDKALYYYKKALKTYANINSKLGSSYSLNNISGVFLHYKQFDSSLVYLERSLKFRRELNDTAAISVSLNDIGEMYLAKSDYPKAIDYFEQSLKISTSIGFKDLQKHTYGLLAECYANIQDFKKAFKYHKQFSLLKDTIFNGQKNKSITEMQTKYDTEKKEQENVILIRENEIKTLELSQKEQQRNIMVGSFALILLLVGFSYNHYRLKNKNKILQEKESRTIAVFQAQEEEKIRISKELHDGVGPLLSLIKLNVSSLDINPSNEKIISKTKELTSESIKEVRNISHSLMPSLLVKSGLQAALTELAEQINAGKLNVELEHKISTKLNPEAEVNIYRIIQESINNILKHSDASNAKIKLEQVDQNLLLTIKDDGKGFDSNNVAAISGNGLNNICSRVDFMKGKITISSNSKTGTSFTIQLPLKQISNG